MITITRLGLIVNDTFLLRGASWSGLSQTSTIITCPFNEFVEGAIFFLSNFVLHFRKLVSIVVKKKPHDWFLRRLFRLYACTVYVVISFSLLQHMFKCESGILVCFVTRAGVAVEASCGLFLNS